MPRGRPLDPETATAVSLHANAGRLASALAPPADAADELREIAGTRTHLLAAFAGTMLGSVLGRPGWSRPEALLAVAYLMLAGADRKVTVERARETAVTVAAPTHTTVNRPTHRG